MSHPNCNWYRYKNIKEELFKICVIILQLAYIILIINLIFQIFIAYYMKIKCIYIILSKFNNIWNAIIFHEWHDIDCCNMISTGIAMVCNEIRDVIASFYRTWQCNHNISQSSEQCLPSSQTRCNNISVQLNSEFRIYCVALRGANLQGRAESSVSAGAALCLQARMRVRITGFSNFSLYNAWSIA